MHKKLVSEEFDVPLTADFAHFVFKPLNESITELDYEAVMSSREALMGVFKPNDSWPAVDLSLEQNRQDLRRHWAQFQDRTAFAWTVLALDHKRCVGCVYFYWPFVNPAFPGL